MERKHGRAESGNDERRGGTAKIGSEIERKEGMKEGRKEGREEGRKGGR